MIFSSENLISIYYYGNSGTCRCSSKLLRNQILLHFCVLIAETSIISNRKKHSSKLEEKAWILHKEKQTLSWLLPIFLTIQPDQQRDRRERRDPGWELDHNLYRDLSPPLHPGSSCCTQREEELESVCTSLMLGGWIVFTRCQTFNMKMAIHTFKDHPCVYVYVHIYIKLYMCSLCVCWRCLNIFIMTNKSPEPSTLIYLNSKHNRFSR